jgi:hypothetical protein
VLEYKAVLRFCAVAVEAEDADEVTSVVEDDEDASTVGRRRALLLLLAGKERRERLV